MSTTIDENATHTAAAEASAPEVTTYRAAVVHNFHDALRIEQVPVAQLQVGQVRVRVEASGLCHTDIHAAHGDWPVKPSPPSSPATRASASSSSGAGA